MPLITRLDDVARSAPDAASTRVCPDCKGAGVVKLLYSVKPCGCRSAAPALHAPIVARSSELSFVFADPANYKFANSIVEKLMGGPPCGAIRVDSAQRLTAGMKAEVVLDATFVDQTTAQCFIDWLPRAWLGYLDRNCYIRQQ